MEHTLASGSTISLVPLHSMKAKHKDAHDGAPKLYMQFNADGTPNLNGMPVSMSVAKAQRNGLLASLLLSWNLEDDQGIQLPVPRWEHDEIVNDASFGEVPIDDWFEIEEILEPYLEKVRRRPDPKKTITGGSSATSKGKEPSRRA